MARGAAGLLLVVMALSALALSVPAAHAQDVPVVRHKIEIAGPGSVGPIPPVTDTATVPIDITVSCEMAEDHVQAHMLAVEVRTDHPWASVSLDSTVWYIGFTPDACLAKTKSQVSVKVSIAFTQAAPAFGRTMVHVTATLDSGEKAERSFNATVGFFERWEARFHKTVFRAEPGQGVQALLEIENLGNGAISLGFTFGEGSSRMLVVALPGLQIVPSSLEDGASNRLVVPIDIRAPDEGGRKDQLQITIVGNSMNDPDLLLESKTLIAVIETGSLFTELPDIGLPLLLLTLLVSSRRR